MSVFRFCEIVTGCSVIEDFGAKLWLSNDLRESQSRKFSLICLNIIRSKNLIRKLLNSWTKLNECVSDLQPFGDWEINNRITVSINFGSDRSSKVCISVFPSEFKDNSVQSYNAVTGLGSFYEIWTYRRPNFKIPLNYLPKKKSEIQVLMELPQSRPCGAEGSYVFFSFNFLKKLINN